MTNTEWTNCQGVTFSEDDAENDRFVPEYLVAPETDYAPEEWADPADLDHRGEWERAYNGR